MSAMVWSVLTIFKYGNAETPHTRDICANTRLFAVNMKMWAFGRWLETCTAVYPEKVMVTMAVALTRLANLQAL